MVSVVVNSVSDLLSVFVSDSFGSFIASVSVIGVCIALFWRCRDAIIK